ncbi:hypothetical protein WDZ16_15035 [Pseudokineococcus marinus]
MASRPPGDAAGGRDDGRRPGAEGAGGPRGGPDGVDDPWGVPSVVHLRAAGASLLLLADAPGAPRVLHWGGDLGDLSVDETEALALAASADRADGHPPGSPVLLAAGPAGATGPAAVDVGRGAAPGGGRGTGPDGSPHVGGGPDAGGGLRVVPAEREPAPVRRSASLGVAGDGTQRLVASSEDPVLGVAVDVVLGLDAVGVLHLGATARVLPGSAVRLRGLHLRLPVPAAGRQVLVDVGGRLRPERSLRPSAGAPATTGRGGDAVVVQTAGSLALELWAMASSAGRGARLDGSGAPPVVRADRRPCGHVELVGGTDASAEGGVLRWTTPALVAAHGDSWPSVRRRLDAAVRAR